ncbi:hypothetical protein ACFE04_031131 [Oxalis oulophora]
MEQTKKITVDHGTVVFAGAVEDRGSSPDLSKLLLLMRLQIIVDPLQHEFPESGRVLTSDYKIIKKNNKSLKKTVKSQHQVITELTSICEELKQFVAQQSVTFADQNTRVVAVENHVMNINAREMMAILARRGGSRSGSNQSDPNQTSAFMDDQATCSIRTVYAFVDEENIINGYSKALQGTIKLGIHQGLNKRWLIGSSIAFAFVNWAYVSYFGSRLVMYHGAQGGTIFAVRGSTTFATILLVADRSEVVAMKSNSSDDDDTPSVETTTMMMTTSRHYFTETNDDGVVDGKADFAVSIIEVLDNMRSVCDLNNLKCKVSYTNGLADLVVDYMGVPKYSGVSMTQHPHYVKVRGCGLYKLSRTLVAAR